MELIKYVKELLIILNEYSSVCSQLEHNDCDVLMVVVMVVMMIMMIPKIQSYAVNLFSSVILYIICNKY